MKMIRAQHLIYTLKRISIGKRYFVMFVTITNSLVIWITKLLNHSSSIIIKITFILTRMDGWVTGGLPTWFAVRCDNDWSSIRPTANWSCSFNLIGSPLTATCTVQTSVITDGNEIYVISANIWAFQRDGGCDNSSLDFVLQSLALA